MIAITTAIVATAYSTGPVPTAAATVWVGRADAHIVTVTTDSWSHSSGNESAIRAREAKERMRLFTSRRHRWQG